MAIVELTENERIAYFMLYKFLKENRIFDKYIANMKKIGRTGNNPKSMLMNLVKGYTRQYVSFDNYSNLFNFAPTSFFWDLSIEGFQFWGDIVPKWIAFYNRHKKELKNINNENMCVL